LIYATFNLELTLKAQSAMLFKVMHSYLSLAKHR